MPKPTTIPESDLIPVEEKDEGAPRPVQARAPPFRTPKRISGLYGFRISESGAKPVTSRLSRSG